MSIDVDQEILRDFLVEAGEILELLGTQLIELEQDPVNSDLLNAVFRGFHTIKGGAGFLNLGPMVELCHRAEDVFNRLRQGERTVDPGLMDVVLDVLDVLNEMFTVVNSGQVPVSAPPQLILDLDRLAHGGAGDESALNTVREAVTQEPETDGGASRAGPTEPDSGDGLDVVVPETASDTGEEIGEVEFEALLDQLHGPGRHRGVVPTESAATTEVNGPDGLVTGQQTSPTDEIAEEAFESLVDGRQGRKRLHGRMDTPVVDTAAASVDNPAVPPSIRRPKRPVEPVHAIPPGETTVRVNTQCLDEIMNLVGELVLVRNRLASLKHLHHDEKLTKAVSDLDLVTTGLQAAAMKTRMQPIKQVFGRFPRVVRDVARTLNKEVALELMGEDTDLDKNLVEALADPLIHLVRNAVDHGIEEPEERLRAGKPRQGKVLLSACPEGDHILLTIEDDGRGMDAQALRGKAVEKGMMDEGEVARLSDVECFGLIFAPGFSTKTEISDVSGRGVGMDVVKTRIEQLNGSVEILSQPGRGTLISIKVPLTLAILSTLMVILKDQHFALPLSSVDEIIDFDAAKTSMVEGQRVILVRDKALPIFHLGHWLTEGYEPGGDDPRGSVVIVHVGSHRVGFVVDRLVGQEEVVIKPLSAYLQGLPGFAGATITGDGQIALILDVAGLMKGYARVAA